MAEPLAKTGTVAKAIIRRRSDGAYLVLWSSKWPERPERSQKPDFPGGEVESGETPEVGCVREILEEAGIAVSPSELQLVYAMTYYYAKDDFWVNRLVYFAEIDDNDVKLSSEHEKYAWLSARELEELEIRPPYKEIITNLIQREIIS